MRWYALALVGVAFTSTALARAEPAAQPDNAVRLTVAELFARTPGNKGDTSGTYSETNGGNAFLANLAYRSPYAFGGFAEIGYYPLYRRDRRLDLGTAGGLTTATGSVVATGVVFGAAIDLWRLRAAAGVGSFSVAVKTTALGVTNEVNESDLGYVLSLAAFPFRWKRIEIGVEARAVFIVEAVLTSACVGLSLGGDIVRW